MSNYKATIPGIEASANEKNKSIFSQMVIPEDLDRETLIDNIIIQCGTYEALYSDIDFLIVAIKTWSKKNLWMWNKWMELYDAEYDPLENYNRHEEYTDLHMGDASHSISRTGSNSVSTSGTTGNTHTYNNVKDSEEFTNLTDETTKSAFNESNYQPYEKNTRNGKDETTKTGNETDAGSNSQSTTGSDSNAEMGTNQDRYTNKHDAHMYGNIGVTTSQQMWEAQWELAKTHNIVDQITDQFITEFTVPVFD